MNRVELFLAIDIRELDNLWALPQKIVRLTFSHREKEIAVIGVEVSGPEKIVLRYEYGQSEPIADSIEIAYSPRHFGGARRWFICPGCEQRKAVLYCAGYFRCRTCLGLAYRSQVETDFERGISRVSARRRKLGGSGSLRDPFPAKPQRMRWKTYRKLQEEDERECLLFLSQSVTALHRILKSQPKADRD